MKTRRLLFVAGLAALLPTSSCHRERETVVVVEVPEPPPPPAPLPIDEVEPNDDALLANDLGFLAPGDHVILRGDLDAFDPADGFRFVSTEPLFVEFFLESHDGADLDVCIFDPEIDDFSLCFETEGTVEEGNFEVIFGNAEFHTVVVPFDFDSRYTLEVFASPLFAPRATGAPATAARAIERGTGVVRGVGTSGSDGAAPDRTRAYAGSEGVAAEQSGLTQ